ncbi:MAG: sugar phosphate isomerase/epimerase [Spirochaetaceae bacterium]|jgi:sugar phosphate isomerase/epimerase|nr:sugar phosphate isomerase/epimerase [Spirochaetaceae bacterium]
MDVSLQLYSIKEEAGQDFAKALELTEKAGYDGVEFAGYYGNTPERIGELLIQYHLKPVSSHVSLERLRDDFEGELRYLNTLGFKLIVCPYSPCRTKEEVLETAAFLQSCALRTAEAGLVMGYHNHSHEFTARFDGRYALDLLLEAAPALQFEPDVFWIANAGVDPAAYIKPYAAAGRICAVHAKDLAKAGAGKTGLNNVYIGEGRIDFPAIAAICPPSRYPYIIEQEEFSTDHFDGISQSLAGLRRLLPD